MSQHETWVNDSIKSTDEKTTATSVASTAPATAINQPKPTLFSLDTEVTLLRDEGATVVRAVPASHLQRTKAMPNIGAAVEGPVALAVCQYFEVSGECNRGHKCRFAHFVGPPCAEAPERHAPAKPAPRGVTARNRNPPPTHPAGGSEPPPQPPAQQPQQHQQHQHHQQRSGGRQQPAPHLGVQVPPPTPLVQVPVAPPWRLNTAGGGGPTTLPAGYPPQASTASIPTFPFLPHHHHQQHQQQLPGVANAGYFVPVAHPPIHHHQQAAGMPTMYPIPPTATTHPQPPAAGAASPFQPAPIASASSTAAAGSGGARDHWPPYPAAPLLEQHHQQQQQLRGPAGSTAAAGRAWDWPPDPAVPLEQHHQQQQQLRGHGNTLW